MSIFSKIGKAIGKVVKKALPIVKFGIGFVPGVGSIASKLLASGVGVKAQKIVATIEKGQSVLKLGGGMPGVTTGPAPPSVGQHILAVKHARTTHKVAHLLKRASGTKKKKRATVATRARRTVKAKPRKSRLKFGSPAWRKKFIKKRR